MNNKIELIREELAKSIPDNAEYIGIFKIQTAKDTIVEASKRSDPEPLFLKLWYEGEVCCLFSDSNLGKSIYAVQIASEIAQNHKVVLFDCELSDKQFQLRYTDDNGSLHSFPDNFLRAEINPEGINDISIEDAIINGIEAVAVGKKSDVIIIDNLTYLCIAAEKSDAAGNLMIRLTGLKRKYGWSILILAHTPKRSLSNPITQNDLAGSKKLYNFFDSAFAIGKSAKDEALRYVKQLKVRHGAYTHGEENVIVYAIEKENAFLHFEYRGTSTEREHLKEVTDKEVKSIETKIQYLRDQGKSFRQIASDLGLSMSKVYRVLEKSKEGSVFNSTNE